MARRLLYRAALDHAVVTWPGAQRNGKTTLK
jgi:hypothetical protein